ncbi:S-layer homology domain-containing protein [Jeotgalibacillus malaysiensis]|uniref:S-layer homology domain-containing protein n=1 Tax=Jeotgalibacillus malaysiensis TaxID=1508404 RepID=UPI0038513062
MMKISPFSSKQVANPLTFYDLLNEENTQLKEVSFLKLRIIFCVLLITLIPSPAKGNSVELSENLPAFPDIDGHWAQTYIESLNEKQIINGKINGKFSPEDQVTRAQFTAMLVRILQLTPVNANYFDDVSGPLQNEISAAYEAGIIKGITPKRFAPNRNITREQMAVMLFRTYNILHNTYYQTFITAPYKDHRHIHFKKEVNAIYQLRLMTGTNQGEFRPKQTATRAQAAKTVYLLGGEE